MNDRCPECGAKMLAHAVPGGCFTIEGHETGGLNCLRWQAEQFRERTEKAEAERGELLVALAKLCALALAVENGYSTYGHVASGGLVQQLGNAARAAEKEMP